MTDDTNTEAINAEEDLVATRRRAMFDAYWTEQQTRERGNSDKYDSTILAYSTGALALSFSFIEHLVPLATAHEIWAIKWSWIFFGVSMLLMIASFPIAQKSNRQSIEYAHKYFIEEDDDYYDKKGWAGYTLLVLNPLAGIVFTFAVIFTGFFIWTNVTEHPMATKNTPSKDLNEGLGSAKMAQIVKKGDMSAKMPPRETTPATTPAAKPAATPPPSKTDK
jgi:hypothetical protein